jgi:hypothetical protein
VKSSSHVMGLMRRWWCSHFAAVVAGGLLSAFFVHRSLLTAGDVGEAFEHEPLDHAAWFAYNWGSSADASELLGRYAARRRADPGWQLETGTEWHAIGEPLPGERITALCRATPRCRPDRLEALILKLSPPESP